MIFESEIQSIDPDILFSAILEELNHGHNASFIVTGNSMWPFICHKRDSVIVTSCEPESLNKGDIILFQTIYGNYILHRITALKDDMFQTTGDGNLYRDSWTPKDHVIAKVITIIRKGKKTDCNSPLWKRISSIWTFLFPIRKPLMKILIHIGHMKARIRKCLAN